MINRWPVYICKGNSLRSISVRFLNFINHLQEQLLAEVKELHQQGVSGNKEAVEKAYRILKKICDLNIQNNLVEAYYGSILALLGRDAVDPLERLEKVRLGLKFLDNAAANEPDNIEIRILRGYVCIRLPEIFFHRTTTAVEDFTYIISRYENDPGIVTKEFYYRLLRDLASAYKTLGDDEEAQLIQMKLQSGD